MSRSYKRTPILQNTYGSNTKKWSKRQASKAVRKYTNYIAEGSAYKNIYCSWDICDYKIREPWNVYTKYYYKSKKDWAKYNYYK